GGSSALSSGCLLGFVHGFALVFPRQKFLDPPVWLRTLVSDTARRGPVSSVFLDISGDPPRGAPDACWRCGRAVGWWAQQAGMGETLGRAVIFERMWRRGNANADSC